MGTYTADDFRTGTAAAAAGGITTVVDWAIQEPGESLFATLEKWDKKAAGKTVIGLQLPRGADRFEPQRARRDQRRREERHCQLQVLRAYKGTPLMQTDSNLFRIMRRVRDTGALFCVHAENGDIIDVLVREYVAQGRLAPIYHATRGPPRSGRGDRARHRARRDRAVPPASWCTSRRRGAAEVREARDAACRSTPRRARTISRFTTRSWSDRLRGRQVRVLAAAAAAGQHAAPLERAPRGESARDSSDHCASTGRSRRSWAVTASRTSPKRHGGDRDDDPRWSSRGCAAVG